MPNFITDDFIDYMKSVEGARKKRGKHYVYSSAEGGRGTVGYGHKLKKGENFGAGLTENQALALLDKDLEIAAKGVSKSIGRAKWDSLSPQRKQMLVDYQFNLGSVKGKFPKFTKAVIAGDWDKIEQEYERSYTSSGGKKKKLQDRNTKFYNKYLSGNVSGMGGIQTMAKTDVRIKGAFENIKGHKDDLEKDMLDPLRHEREKEEKDEFGAASSDDYFANSEYSKKHLEESYRGFVAKGMKLLHSPNMREKVFKILQGPNPIESVAKIGVGIVQRIDRAATQSGKKIPDEIKLAAANNLMGQVMEVGEASGLAPLDAKEKQVAFSQGINMYISDEIKAGRINKEELAEANGQSVGNMSPEQRSQVDRQMKEINETAMAANKKYGGGVDIGAMASAQPQQPQQPEQDDITQQTGGMSDGLLA